MRFRRTAGRIDLTSGPLNGEVVNSFFSSQNRFYDKELTKLYPYDSAKAKQMLTEAGWDSKR